MKHLSNKIYRKIIFLTKYFYRLMTTRNKTSPPPRLARRKAVYFDLPFDIFNRYIYTLAFHFTECGYDVYFSSRPGFLGSIGTVDRLSELLLETPGIWFSRKEPKAANMRFCLEGEEHKHPGFIPMTCDYFTSNFADQSGFYVPMSFHPLIYHRGIFRQASNFYNRSNRRLGIFFAGSWNEKLYGSNNPDFGNSVETLFQKIPRFQLINHLLQNLPIETILQPSSVEELNSESVSGKIVLINSDHMRVLPNKLLELLSHSSFFLAPVGMGMPLCHNIIEAMWAGSIPILEYPEYFPKPLEHGKNCLVFKDRNDLLLKIQYALEMSESEVSAMRHNVLEYYEQNLSSQAVVRQLEDCYGQIRKLYLIADWPSVNVFRKNLSMVVSEQLKIGSVSSS